MKYRSTTSSIPSSPASRPASRSARSFEWPYCDSGRSGASSATRPSTRPYTDEDEASSTRRTPASAAAASTDSVVCTFPAS